MGDREKAPIVLGVLHRAVGIGLAFSVDVEVQAKTLEHAEGVDKTSKQ